MVEKINGNFEISKAPETSYVKPQKAEGKKGPIQFERLSANESKAIEGQIKSNEARIKQLEKEYNKINIPQKPAKPAPDSSKPVTVEFGNTLSGLAEKYHCTVADIEKANPEVKTGTLQAGQKLKMPFVSDKKWAPYAKTLDNINALEHKKYELERKIRDLQFEIARDKRILKAESILGEIQSCRRADTFEERYTIRIDRKTGNLKLKLKEPQKMYTIKSDFHLADGVIREANKDKDGETILKNFERPRSWFLDNVNYDDYTAPAGTELVLPTDACRPKTAWYK